MPTAPANDALTDPVVSLSFTSPSPSAPTPVPVQAALHRLSPPSAGEEESRDASFSDFDAYYGQSLYDELGSGTATSAATVSAQPDGTAAQGASSSSAYSTASLFDIGSPIGWDAELRAPDGSNHGGSNTLSSGVAGGRGRGRSVLTTTGPRGGAGQQQQPQRFVGGPMNGYTFGGRGGGGGGGGGIGSVIASSSFVTAFPEYEDDPTVEEDAFLGGAGRQRRAPPCR